MPQPQVNVETQKRMVLTTPLKKIIGSAASVIPTSQYPWLRDITTQLIFRCGSCKSGGVGEWYTFEDAAKVPISGPGVPGRASIGPNGMITTRFGMHCPQCGCVMSGAFVQNGIIDLLHVPKGYKRPPMPPEATGDNVGFDSEAEQDGLPPAAVRTGKPSTPFGKGMKKKKKSDLNPKSKAKAAPKAPEAGAPGA
jgi:hypothetical protein